MKNKFVSIYGFTLEDKKATLLFRNENGIEGTASIVSERDVVFTEVHETFLRDTLVMYVCSDLCIVSDAIGIKVPVTAYLEDTLEKFLSRLFSWVSYFNKEEVVCPLVFTEIFNREGFGYTPTLKKAIIGWSRGKESIASYEIAKEAGYEVVKATFNKPIDENADAHFSLRVTGELFYDPTTIYPVFKKGYFDYQGYICLPLLAMLMLQGREEKVSTLLIGSEYGTSDEWTIGEDTFLDLAADESLEAAQYITKWIKKSFDTTVEIHSPVSTLAEVAILRYILSKGYTYKGLESCWHYSTLNGTNCEACLKCNRLKIYGKYLVDRGYLKQEDFNTAFTTFDFADIAYPMLITYSMASEKFISQIGLNDKTIDWANVWNNNTREVTFTGPDFLAVVKRHFTELDYYYSQVTNPRIEIMPHEQAVEECVRYVREDYRELIRDRYPVIAITDILLPMEHEVFKEKDTHLFNVLAYFSEWVVFNGKEPSKIIRPLGLVIPRLFEHRCYETKSPIVKIWMQESNITALFKRIDVKYELLPYEQV